MQNISYTAEQRNNNSLPIARTRQKTLALDTVRNGIPVFPVSSTHKRPLTVHGYKDATIDADEICNRWQQFPNAFVSIPTGEPSGLIVLDVDTGGEGAFNTLLAELGCETIDDLTPSWAVTPSGGLHAYFAFEPGTSPRTRAGDIAQHIDVRGIGGSIVIPGNVRSSDGLAYRWGTDRGSLFDLPPMPRELLFLATFNASERRLIAETPALSDLRRSPATQWAGMLQDWRNAEAKAAADRSQRWAGDDDGMRRQARADLQAVAREIATLTDGRRHKLFGLACRVGKYVNHKQLSEGEFLATLQQATAENGALTKYGPTWVAHTLRSAIIKSRGDQLPPLARAFRTGGR